MNPTDPRRQAALDAAVSQINNDRGRRWPIASSDLLGTLSLSATRIAERDALLAAQFDLRRNMATFHLAFRDTLRETRRTRTWRRAPTAGAAWTRPTGSRSAWSTTTRSRSSMFADRIAQRDHARVRVGAARAGRRTWARCCAPAAPTTTATRCAPRSIGAAMYRAIEAVTERQPRPRKLLARELGHGHGQGDGRVLRARSCATCRPAACSRPA